ncbi:hypothetical protein AVEN_55734-1 [Araneus ventricosus]|uniref:Uncharacterized protein n=1 Tax=Araneus ventricosus TaxID=182803 RepID=A0A4Y2QQN7_ARAVE|nr:hypothetical protein AVEN_55734-1 [Araneus ventricosus]
MFRNEGGRDVPPLIRSPLSHPLTIWRQLKPRDGAIFGQNKIETARLREIENRLNCEIGERAKCKAGIFRKSGGIDFHIRHLSERRTNSFNPAWEKSRPCPLSKFSEAIFTSLSEENLVPDKCSFNLGKRKLSLGHREAIRDKYPGMLSDGLILLHDNTHTLLTKLKNCCESSSGKSGKVQVGSPIQPRFGTQSGFQTLIWDKVLFKQ